MRSTILALCMLVTLSAYMSSCKKLDFNYRQFIGDGEITYLGKADSLKVRGGDHRAELTWLLVADPKVTSYKVYWDSRQDSAVGSLTKTDDVDTVRLILENLEEKVYEFEVVLYDDEGNSSVATSAIGQVWGTRYRDNLVNRVFKSTRELPDNELEIDWSWSDPMLLYSEVKYQDVDDNIVTHIVRPEVTLDTLKKFVAGRTFELRSVFRPDTSAIDIFHSDYETFQTEPAAYVWNMEFITTLQYGNQPNQLSVWVSQDFNGVYDATNVEAATWTNVTNQFSLATGTAQTGSGPMDIESLLADGYYVAFRYNFVPGEGSQRTWTIRGFEVTKTKFNEEVVYDTGAAAFQIVTKGPYESGRLAISAANVITLRGNSQDTETAVTAWAISKKMAK